MSRLEHFHGAFANARNHVDEYHSAEVEGGMDTHPLEGAIKEMKKRPGGREYLKRQMKKESN